MKILLDTQILVWAFENKMPRKAVPYINDMNNFLLFSSVSIWEIAIKNGLRKIIIDPASLYRGLLGAGYEELPLTAHHALSIENLPKLHKDPFDHILLAQATSEGIPFLTADKYLSQYPGAIIFVG